MSRIAFDTHYLVLKYFPEAIDNGGQVGFYVGCKYDDVIFGQKKGSVPKPIVMDKQGYADYAKLTLSYNGAYPVPAQVEATSYTGAHFTVQYHPY